MRLQSILVALVALGVLARRGAAQAVADGNPVGVWRGTSLCQVRPSPCNDEIVVDRITRAKGSDSLSMDARKIVRGREEEMGVLPCRFDARSASFTCSLAKGVWRFAVRGDSLTGEAILSDGTRYREVRAARSR